MVCNIYIYTYIYMYIGFFFMRLQNIQHDRRKIFIALQNY